jgi:uncharacterized membrane protein
MTALREKLFSPFVQKELQTEWRGRDISRIEGFSDAVFGFAVTLLVVALEVPRTSGELLDTMRGFGSFLITFAILFSIWYRQFIFFRRYGLEDRTTVALNGVLIVVVLFFVYPLKFIFTAMISRIEGIKVITLADGALFRSCRRSTSLICSPSTESDWPRFLSCSRCSIDTPTAIVTS